MTQENKQLLLKDLCARLPYKPKALVNGHLTTILGIDEDVVIVCIDGNDYKDEIVVSADDNGDDIKLYLRPMSSMTEEEFNELHELCPHSVFNATNVPGWIVGINGSDYGRIARTDEIMVFIDWLNKNMFDYRGLIPAGLAIVAPDGMYLKKN